MNGKGSKRRPTNEEKYRENYVKIFRKTEYFIRKIEESRLKSIKSNIKFP